MSRSIIVVLRVWSHKAHVTGCKAYAYYSWSDGSACRGPSLRNEAKNDNGDNIRRPSQASCQRSRKHQPAGEAPSSHPTTINGVLVDVNVAAKQDQTRFIAGAAVVPLCRSVVWQLSRGSSCQVEP